MQSMRWGAFVAAMLLFLLSADNRKCVGGTNAGNACAKDSDCTGGGQCAGITSAPDRGLPRNTFCPPNGSSNDIAQLVRVCYGGANAGMECRNPGHCPSAGDGKPTFCGPKKAEPTNARDADADGDTRKDYFMGEWEFVDAATKRNVAVRKWCLNGGAPKLIATCEGGTAAGQACASDAVCAGGGKCTGRDIAFGDAFSFEVRTSRNGTENEEETKRVRPGGGALT